MEAGKVGETRKEEVRKMRERKGKEVGQVLQGKCWGVCRWNVGEVGKIMEGISRGIERK